MTQMCYSKNCSLPALLEFTNRFCRYHTIEYKSMCKKNNLCVRCSCENPDKPVTLSEDGLLCPVCDFDEYGSSANSSACESTSTK